MSDTSDIVEALDAFFDLGADGEIPTGGDLALISRAQREITVLRMQLGHVGHLRFKADWFYCERGGPGDDRPYEECFVRSPNLDEWDHVVPAMWIDDPEWIEAHGGKPGGMPR